MALTGKMTTHALDFIKGWPFGDAMDTEGLFSANVTVSPVYAGTVVYHNSSKQFELGARGTAMPIFLKEGSHDLDVDINGGTEWYNVLPAKVVSGLIATGGFLLETTEFNKVGNPVYAPGDRLKSPTEAQVNGTDKTKAGKLYKTTAYAASDVAFTFGTQQICGIVAKEGNYTSTHRTAVLQFYTVFVPGSE